MFEFNTWVVNNLIAGVKNGAFPREWAAVQLGIISRAEKSQRLTSRDLTRKRQSLPPKSLKKLRRWQMENDIIVAMISLLGTLGGSLGGILVSSKLTTYRLQQLENRVAEHNNFARRMPVIEEQIKVINHRIEDLEQEEKRHEN